MATDEITDIVSVGVSDGTSEALNQLAELGHIGELSDGYRLGIAVALSFGRIPRPTARTGRRTFLAASGLDPDGSIKAAIREIYPETRDWPYRAAEDLAEQGVEILTSCMQGEDLSLSELMTRLKEANSAEPAVMSDDRDSGTGEADPS